MKPTQARTVITLPKLAGADTGGSTMDVERAGPETLPLPEPALDTPARPAPAPQRTRSAFVPLLLMNLAMLGWLGFQGWQLAVNQQALQAAHASQQQTVENAAKLRASLDGLAADTQRLADSGNASARLLVEELKKRGVTINAAAKP